MSVLAALTLQSAREVETERCKEVEGEDTHTHRQLLVLTGHGTGLSGGVPTHRTSIFQAVDEQNSPSRSQRQLVRGTRTLTEKRVMG